MGFILLPSNYGMHSIVFTPPSHLTFPLPAPVHSFPHSAQSLFNFHVYKNENWMLQMRENVIFVNLGLAYLA